MFREEVSGQRLQGLSHGKRLAHLFEIWVERRWDPERTRLWEPTFVIDHPIEISPLAKAHPERPGVADRFDPALGRRVSFEERVMRCYAGPMNGFVPTLYDPAVRDLRILARAVAHHLGLGEGARR